MGRGEARRGTAARTGPGTVSESFPFPALRDTTPASSASGKNPQMFPLVMHLYQAASPGGSPFICSYGQRLPSPQAYEWIYKSIVGCSWLLAASQPPAANGPVGTQPSGSRTPRLPAVLPRSGISRWRKQKGSGSGAHCVRTKPQNDRP